MSNADFLKHLFLAAVESGQVKAGSSPHDAAQVMENLMTQYLQAAQHMGRLNRRVRKRVSPMQTGPVAQDDSPDWTAQRGGALPS